MFIFVYLLQQCLQTTVSLVSLSVLHFNTFSYIHIMILDVYSTEILNNLILMFDHLFILIVIIKFLNILHYFFVIFCMYIGCTSLTFNCFMENTLQIILTDYLIGDYEIY